MTGTPTSTVEKAYPDFKRVAESVAFNPRKFRTQSPDLYKMVMENPDLAPIALKDQKLSEFAKLNARIGLWTEQHPWMTKVGQAMAPWSIASPDLTNPLVGLGIVATGLPELPEKQVAYQQSGITDTLGMVKDTFLRSRAESEISSLGVRAMLVDQEAEMLRSVDPMGLSEETARAEGEAYTLHKTIIDKRNALGAQPDYEENQAQRMLLDATEGMASQIDTYKGLGVGASIGAGVGAAVGAVIGKSPSSAGMGAKEGARLGGMIGTFVTTFQAEAGGDYLENLKTRDESGKAMDPKVARAAAIVSGTVKAVIEDLSTFGFQLNSLGAVGEVLKKGASARGALELAKLPRFVGMAKGFTENVVGEGLEEWAQEWIGQFSRWAGSSVSAGDTQTFDWQEARTQASEAGWKGAMGGLGIGAGQTVIAQAARGSLGLVSHGIEESRRRRGQAAAHGLLDAAQSDTAKSAPKAVAKMVVDASARLGRPIRELYLDPIQFSAAADQAGYDPRELAVEMFGEEGPAKVQAALSARREEDGGRNSLAIPVGLAFSKVLQHPAALLLGNHFTAVKNGTTALEDKATAEATPKMIQARAKEIQEEAKASGGWQTRTAPEAALVQAVEQHLTATKRFTPENVDAMTATSRAIVETQSKVTGIAPDELFAAFSVKIQNETESVTQGTAEAAQDKQEVEQSSTGISEEMKSAVVATADGTQASIQLAERLRTLRKSPEALGREMWVDSNTGLSNGRAFPRLPRDPARPLVAHYSFEGTKWKNNQSHTDGDLLYRAAGQAVAAIVQDGARFGGDFVSYVATPEEAQNNATAMQERMTAALKESNPELADKIQGLQVTVQTAPAGENVEASIEALSEVHGKTKEAAETAGTRAKRGTKPLGLPMDTPDFLSLPTSEAPPRALPADLVAEALAMSDEGLFNKMYRDKHGFLTRQGWNGIPRKAHIVSLDLNGLKAINKHYTTKVGDRVLALLAELAHAAGASAMDMARLGGDEFAAQTDDPLLAQEFVDILGWLADNADLDLATPEGAVHGIQFGYGIGPDFDSADKLIESSKQRARDHRAEKGSPDRDPERLARRDRALNRRRGDLSERSDSLRGGARSQIFPGARKAPGQTSADVRRARLNSPLDRALAGVRKQVAKLDESDPQQLKQALQRAIAEGAPLNNHLITAIGLVNAAKALTQKKREVGGEDKLVAGSYKSAIRDVLEASGLTDNHASEKQDNLYQRWVEGDRKGPKPFYEQLADHFDALNQDLGGLSGGSRVSGVLEYLYEKLHGDLRWTAIEKAFDVVRAVPGYNSIRMPQGVIEQRAAALEALRSEPEAEPTINENGDLVGDDGEVLFQGGGKKQTETPEFKTWFKDSKVVDETGAPVRVFHGAKRPDRIGAQFRKTRATSGPMAFFTDDPEIASNYSMHKSDTSFEHPDDYGGWFTTKVGRSKVDLNSAWWNLTPEKRNEISEKLPHVVRVVDTSKGYENTTDEFRLGGPDEYGLADKGHWDYEINAARGNVLKAAKETWLNSAGLFDEEELFLKVLDQGGAKGLFDFETPWAEYPSVYPAYLSIQNPLDTHAIPEEVVVAIEKASRRQRKPAEHGADFWDKTTRDPKEWVAELKDNIAKGGDTVWTSIPDWVTKTLKGFGYDGIQDRGGKFAPGEKKHHVWIPFDDKQVKSETGNRGTFDPNSANILKQGDKDTRGLIKIARQGLNKAFTIILKDQSDLSTPLHELAHAYFEMLGDLSERDDVPSRVKDDFSKILAHVGAKDRESVTRDQKEKFAAAWEQYLMEGKAPSLDLVPVFTRFRAWLLKIYRTIQGLAERLGVDPELNDDLRSVFDHMLATDDEIALMKAATGLNTPMFRTAEEAGMTPKAFSRYLSDLRDEQSRAELRVQRKVAESQRRTMTDEWKKEVKEARKKAASDYDRMPSVRAWRFLKNGEATNDAGEIQPELSGPDQGLLDRAEAKRLLPKYLTDKLRGRFTQDGMSLTEVAQRFGYPSRLDLINAIIPEPVRNREKTIREAAEKSVRDAHPELATERDTIEEAFLRAAHQEGTADSLLKEWAALLARGRVAGMPPVESIKKAAARQADEQLVRRLSLGNVSSAETRAAEQAIAAAARGDFQAAAKAKEEQLLNHFLYSELEKARDEREQFEDLAKHFTLPTRRKNLGRAGEEYINAADTILESVGAKPIVDSEIMADRTPLLDALKMLEADGIILGVSPDELVDLVGRKDNWKSYQVGELRVLRKAMAQLYTAAVQKNFAFISGKKEEIAEIAATIATEAKELGDKGPAPGSETAKTKGKVQAPGIRQELQGIGAALADPEEMIRELGPTAYRTLWSQGYLSAREAEDTMTVEVTEKFIEMWNKLPKSIQDRRYDLMKDLDGVEYPSDVNRDSASRDRLWMLMVALNMGNESNKERLLGGYQWDETKVRAWLDRNMTEEEWHFVQDVWDLLDKKLWPEVAKAFKEVNGIEPDKIEPVAFKTKFGVFRGGYFPARYDPVASRLGRAQTEEELSRAMGLSGTRMTVAKNFTKSRSKRYEDVVSLQWSVLPAHIVSVVHYATHDRVVRDSSRILTAGQTQKAIQSGLGMKYVEQFTGTGGWLPAVANFGADSIPAAIEAAMRPLHLARSRMVLSTLGWSLGVAAGDLANPLVSLAAGHISAAGLAAATIKTIPLATWGATRREALAKSPELRHREKNLTQLLRNELMQVGRKGAKGRVQGLVEGARDTAWFLFEQTDKLASTVVWRAAYYDGLRQPNATEDSAVSHADEQVRRSLPSHAPGEQPSILRDKRGFGSLIAFYGYFSKLQNVHRGIWNENGPAKALARSLAVILVANVFAEFLSGRGPEDDESVPEWVLRKALAAPFSLLPLVGFIGEYGSSALVSKMFDGDTKFRPLSMRASPAAAGVERLVGHLSHLADEDRDNDQRFWDAIEAAGVLSGMPFLSAQVGRTGRYLTGDEGLSQDIEEGDLAGVASGIFRGKREGQAANIFTPFAQE
jgi:GGDEF domain-containing protein